MLVPLLIVIVKLGVHLPTILRGFIFYIQISPIAVGFLPENFKLRVDVVSDLLLTEYFISILCQILTSPHRCLVLQVLWLSMYRMTLISMRG